MVHTTFSVQGGAVKDPLYLEWSLRNLCHLKRTENCSAAITKFTWYLARFFIKTLLGIMMF